MKSYKLLLSLVLVNSIYINSATDDLQEYQVEIIIFKNLEKNSDEVFDLELKMPEGEMLNFYSPNIKVNKKLIQNNKEKSIFLDFFKDIRPFKSQINEDKKKSKISVANPERWFRKSSDLNTLKKIKNKLSSKKQYKVLDSYTWIQNISSKNDSKYLFEANIENSFGYYLKFYKTRFMHIDIKAYLGNAGNTSNDLITQSYINKFDKKLLENVKEKNNVDVNLKLNDENEFFEIDLNKNTKSLEGTESDKLNIYIDEEKRIFNEEIHYFDHPFFGIIVSVKAV